MASISIEIDEKKLKELILAYFDEKLGDIAFEEKDVIIQVKSKQNYKSEWEIAQFRATVNKTI